MEKRVLSARLKIVTYGIYLRASRYVKVTYFMYVHSRECSCMWTQRIRIGERSRVHKRGVLDGDGVERVIILEPLRPIVRPFSQNLWGPFLAELNCCPFTIWQCTSFDKWRTCVNWTQWKLDDDRDNWSEWKKGSLSIDWVTLMESRMLCFGIFFVNSAQRYTQCVESRVCEELVTK